jgi:tetratricopeptide (TPR) repeat protein
LRLDPADVTAHVIRGGILCALGRADRGLLDFEEALLLDPASAAAHFNRGMADLTLRRFVTAVEDFTAALRLVPDLDRGYFQRGRAYQSLRQYGPAAADLRTAVKLKPDDARYLNQLAWLLACCPDDAVRDGAAAVDLAGRACELAAGMDPAILDTLAVARAECGDFAAAIRTAEDGLKQADADVAEVLRERLRLFRSGKPYRDDGS